MSGRLRNATVIVGVPGLPGPPGPGSATNLSTTRTATAVTIASDTGTDAAIAAADGTNAGVMTAAQQTKLAGIAAGAEVNVNTDWNATAGDAQLLNKPATFPPSAHTHGVTDLTATGTRDSTTYLRGDNTWATPAGGGSAFPSVVTLQDHFMTGATTNGTIGDLGWSVSGGSLTLVNAEAGHPGIVRRGTGTTSGTITSIQLRSSSTSMRMDDTFDLRWGIRVGTVDANTRVRAGTMFQPTADPSSFGAYLEKLTTDTTWFTVTRASDVETRTNTGVTVGSDWITLRIRRIDGTTVGFSINNGTEITHTTNVPTGVTLPGAHIVNAEAANKTIDIDWFRLDLTGLAG